MATLRRDLAFHLTDKCIGAVLHRCQFFMRCVGAFSESDDDPGVGGLSDTCLKRGLVTDNRVLHQEFSVYW
jgi:hypothetical protein